jgi:hypothetical protein
VRILPILLLAGASATAAADRPPEPPPFSSLDRTTGGSGAGADLAVQRFDDGDFDGGNVDDDHALRIDLHGEYALANRFGIIASLPAMWSDIHGDQKTGIGAVHVGGYGHLTLADGHELFLRGGAQLPTETYVPDGTYVDEVMMHAFGFQRLEDPSLSSGAVWLRGGASYRLRLGELAAQLDYLVDLPVGGDLDPVSDIAPDGFWARVVFAGGVAWAPRRWAIAAEAVAAGFPYVDMSEEGCWAPDVLEATFCEQVTTVATLSARWHVDPMVLSLWISAPLDDTIRSHDVIIIGLGARSSF